MSSADRCPPVPPLMPQVKPTNVINAAGVTGRPNVDWCEDHKVGAALGALCAAVPCSEEA